MRTDVFSRFTPSLTERAAVGLGLLLIMTFAGSGSADDVTFSFAASMGGTSSEQGWAIAVGPLGDIYTTGGFSGTVDFDPGEGTANLTSAGSTDIFISKLDSNGNFVWARAVGGTSYDLGIGIAIDLSGNVFTTGFFGDTVDFDPGDETAELSSAGDSDIFVSKLGPSGRFLWAKAFSGTDASKGQGIAVDASGSVLTTGGFQGTVDFDPGAGTANLTSAGSGDVFVSKLDSAGSFVWARAWGGTSADWGLGLAADSLGNVYTTGFFGGTADFDPGDDTANLTSAGSGDIFVSTLDSAGNFLWARAMGGMSTDWGYGIAVDPSRNVFITGFFNDTVDFDPGDETAELASAGGNDVFITKLNPTGNFLWAQAMGGTSSDWGYDIAVDLSDNVYTTGFFGDTVDFDPGDETAELTSAGGIDIFVSKLRPTGRFLWAMAMGGMEDDSGYGIVVDALGTVYTTGFFQDTADFDPGDDTANLTSAGDDDVFVSKLDAVLPESGDGNCLVATAAYGTPMSAKIVTLRSVRDAYMLRNAFGAAFVDTYYRLSPPVADCISKSEGTRAAVRVLLLPILLLSKSALAAPLSTLLLLSVCSLLLVDAALCRFR